MIKTTKRFLGIMSTVFLLAIMASHSRAIAEGPLLEYSPVADFGDVLIESENTLIVTITNRSNESLSILWGWDVNPCGFESSKNFRTVAKDDFVDVTLNWVPSTIGECSSILLIRNGFDPIAEVEVTGNAVSEVANTEIPEMEGLVDAFDEWVANGDIVGKGRGKAGAHYLKAYRNALVKAVHLMERGQARKAQMRLIMAQKHAPFLLRGYALPDLRQKLSDAIASLKHQGVRHLETAEGERPEPGIILDAYDEWVQCGDIKGLGLSKVAGKQVQEFRKKLEKAADLMEQGRTKQAYAQLMEAQKLTRVFIRGVALDDLRAMLSDMLESLRA